MDDFSTLREYQEYLRNRMEAARKGEGVEKVVLLGFVSGGKHYLVDGRDVVDVHQMTNLEPIPAAKPWAIGAANIKGSVYAVTDFSILAGGERTRRGKFMVVAPGIMAGSAILIEAISGLFDVKDVGELTPPTDAQVPAWVIGSYFINGHKNFVLDIAKLAIDHRFSKLQSGDTQ